MTPRELYEKELLKKVLDDPRYAEWVSKLGVDKANAIAEAWVKQDYDRLSWAQKALVNVMWTFDND